MENEFDDYEIEQASREMRRLAAGAQSLQRKQVEQSAMKSIHDGTARAVQEAGLNPEDYNQLLYADADISVREQEKAAYKMAKKVIAKAAAKRGAVQDPKTGKYVKAAAAPQPGNPSRPQDLKSIAEQRQAGKLDSNKALDQMIGTVLGDFFRQTAGS